MKHDATTSSEQVRMHVLGVAAVHRCVRVAVPPALRLLETALAARDVPLTRHSVAGAVSETATDALARAFRGLAIST